MSTILLVEDNPHIMKINAEVLSLHGYEVLRAGTAAEAREQLVAPGKPDCAGYHAAGRQRCRTVPGAERALSYPHPFLTALGENQDVVEGLRAGGDDYLPKPYDLEVLVARIEARLRSDANSRRYVCYGGLKLDTVSFIGYVGGRDILLTQKEFAVLLLLTQNAEHKVSQTELMREVWGAESEMEKRALWTLISRLRKKLHSEDSRLEISSLRGGGYLLEQL